MPRLLVDTNVLIDLTSADRPDHANAMAAVRLAAARDDCALFALASSLKDVYYVYRRHYGSEPEARLKVAKLMDIFELAGLLPEHAKTAICSDEPDFEDGLVRAAAEALGCDYLLTRDAAGFKASHVRKVEAVELVELLRPQG